MSYVSQIIDEVIRKNPGEPEFHQAATEILESLEVVFEKHPELAAIKRSLYDSGAVYASMSGSGSALFALYRKDSL